MKEIDFTPMTTARVTQAEFAVLAGVSRVTVNNWMHKRLGVHEARAPRITRLLSVLANAVAQERLPLKDTPRDQRTEAIKRIVVETLSGAAK